MSFAQLKSKRTDMAKLVEAAQGVAEGNNSRPAADERLWQPTRDKAGSLSLERCAPPNHRRDQQ